MALLTVSSKGWVVIPAELRRKYGLTSGAQLRAVDYGGVLSLIPVMDDPIEQAAGLLKSSKSMMQTLLNEHIQEVAHER